MADEINRLRNDVNRLTGLVEPRLFYESHKPPDISKSPDEIPLAVITTEFVGATPNKTVTFFGRETYAKD